MAKTENITVRIEPTLKKAAENTLNVLGFNMADAITVFLKQVVMTGSIPFQIKIPKYTDEMLEAIAEVDAMKKNPELAKEFSSSQELMEDLENNE